MAFSSKVRGVPVRGKKRLASIRSDGDLLNALVVGMGLCWSLAFVAIALAHQLELYADGAMFSYAIALQDVWAFHWHNISGRTSVFLLGLWPAETLVGLTANPWSGILLYGFIFYVAPLAGLIGTFAADRSRGRVIFGYACCSTALLCPLVFGFPTEMWMAHAMFWPALALSHYGRPNLAGAALVFFVMLALAFTHEGALVLAFTITATLVPRGLRDHAFVRAASALVLVSAIAAASKIVLPPDEYYASALLRAALHFFDLAIFEVSVVVLVLAVLAGYVVTFVALSRLSPRRAYVYAAAIVAVALTIYWMRFDHAIHASSRYYLRTALVIFTPILGALAALDAMSGDGIVARRVAKVARALMLLRDRGARPLAAVFVLLTLVHVVETEKFVAGWTRYRAAVAALAMGDQSDPKLGNPAFVSSERISSSLSPLSWFSTTPYLSAILANFTPKRLVVDPAGNYFWLSCATASDNAESPRAVPKQTRDLIRSYSCLHR